MKNLIIVILLFVVATDNKCQWSNDPTVNNPICLASNYQDQPQIVEDGTGGAIIVWEDFRNGFNYNIYAQRIDKTGVVQWTTNGVVIASLINDQTTPQIIADGNGGAIITWTDFRSGNYSDIFAQKIDANGSVLWQVNGVGICTATNSQYDPKIASDGAGGAIITWVDKRNGGALDIYAQRISSSGTVLWAIDGVLICNEINKQENPSVASDGLGGAIIVWQDYRSNTDYDIYTQRINANGVVQWTVNGLSICNLTGNQVYPKIINNNTDEVIVTWFDVRNGIDPDIYAQRLRNDGTVLWTSNGIALCTVTSLQQFPVLVEDGAGGAIVTWQDYRSGTYDVYAQRVDVDGNVLWGADGVPVSAESNAQMSPEITSDGRGGAVITWRDYRDNGNQDIYAQRIDNNGTVQWTENGIAVCIATNDQYTPAITTDGNGGAIIAWWDFRAGPYSVDADIYAQQVSINGQLGVVTDAESDISSLPESFHLNQNYPNPFNPSTTIKFEIPKTTHVSLKIYNILGQEVAELVNQELKQGVYNVKWNASNLASGVYVYRLKAGDPSTISGQNFISVKKMLLVK